MRERRAVAGRRGMGLLLLVILFMFLAWSLRVAFVNFDGLADLTVDGLLNEVLRTIIFVGPVLLYLRYVERAPALEFLEIRASGRNAAWLLPLVGALLMGWFLTLDRMIGDGRIGGAAATIVLFTVFSPYHSRRRDPLPGLPAEQAPADRGLLAGQPRLFGAVRPDPRPRLDRPRQVRHAFCGRGLRGSRGCRDALRLGDEEDRLVVERIRAPRPPQPAGGRGPQLLTRAASAVSAVPFVSSRLRILPVTIFGSSSTKVTLRGYL